MTGWGILENLLSDLIIILIAILISWLWTTFTYRRNLLKFFNTLKIKKLVIYLSNINVLPFGAIGISQRKYSYQGETVAYGEMQAANQIQYLFRFIIPKLAEISRPIGSFLLSDVKLNIYISPRENLEFDSESSIISLGSPVFNSVSQYIENIENGAVKFQQGSKFLSELEEDFGPYSISEESSSDPASYSTNGKSRLIVKSINGYDGGTVTPKQPDTGIALITGNQIKEISSAILMNDLPPISDTKYGFIERIKDPIGNRFLFYVAGLSEYSTMGAGYYLSANWKYLYKKYGSTKSFIILIKFDKLDIAKWSIVSEKEIHF